MLLFYSYLGSFFSVLSLPLFVGFHPFCSFLRFPFSFSFLSPSSSPLTFSLPTFDFVPSPSSVPILSFPPSSPPSLPSYVPSSLLLASPLPLFLPLSFPSHLPSIPVLSTPPPPQTPRANGTQNGARRGEAGTRNEERGTGEETRTAERNGGFQSK